MLDGIAAARAHRRSEHPNLPESTSRSKLKARDAIYDEQAKRALKALHASSEPMSAGEIATAAGIPTHRARAILLKQPEATLLYNGRWAVTKP